MAHVTRAAPLRILCIHGYRQNGSTFREKTGALRKLVKKQVEWVYMSAPHRVPAPQQPAEGQENGVGSGGDEDPRGWWFSDAKTQSFNAEQHCQSSLGLEESVAAVMVAMKDLGPFDGVLGFSQGAAFVAMLCSLQEQNVEPELRFRFAILVAGFQSLCSEHQRFYNLSAPLLIPSLHVFGQEDRVIPDRMSRELLTVFKDPLVLTHPGGHFLPATSAHRQTYLDFLKRFQQGEETL